MEHIKTASLLVIIFIIFAIGILIGSNLGLISEQFSASAEYGEWADNGKAVIEIPVVGINNEGKGVIGKLVTEVKQGNGMVLMNVNDVIADYEMQLSARAAARAAANATNLNLSNIDILYNL
ncbi:hypothetical protein HZB88_02000, partial [archaeon]|nr:hypothetical protein [archaeon]